MTEPKEKTRNGPMVKRICKTCRHAEWAIAKDGRVNSKQAGRCLWPVPDFSDFPFMMETRAIKKGIWFGFDTECPAWEAKDG